MPRWWCLLWSPRIPDPWPEGAWHCPECGRVLVGEGRPGRSGMLRYEAYTRAERVTECLVHGTALPAEQQRALSPEDIRSRTLVMAATLERRWAKRLRRATSLYDIAHYLWWLQRDPCTTVDTAEVDRLLYAIGLLFPAPGPVPTPPPLTYGGRWQW